MSSREYNIGDIVAIDQEKPAWHHLAERGEGYPLKLQGIVAEIREETYIVKFAGWTAYLKECDLVKLS